MKIYELIEHLEKQGTWVNFDKTRDLVLYGDPNQEIKKVGVCWVATFKVIEAALKEGINFIISHENLFYETNTSPRKHIIENNKRKEALLKSGDIVVYRCHDVWDKMPEYGVADSWAKDIGLPFKRELTSFNSFCQLNEPLSVLEVAKKVQKACVNQEAVQVIGDLNQKVKKIAIGTGAATDLFSMLKKEVELCVLSDDGSNSWVEFQWAIDSKLPLIIVNHAACEISGIRMMVSYLKKYFEALDVSYLEEGYYLHSIGENS